jgi:hypothetical protein
MNLRYCITEPRQICDEQVISGSISCYNRTGYEVERQSKQVKLHHDRRSGTLRMGMGGLCREFIRIPSGRSSRTRIFGNFAEVKAAGVRAEATANHLTYIGEHCVRAQAIAAASRLIICDLQTNLSSIARDHQVDTPRRAVEVRTRQPRKIRCAALLA